MDFLAPLFAAVGVAAAAVPLVLHMLRRAPTQKMPFSVVRFLKPSRPKLTKRSTIEHWPLLLLRVLALILIGLAFARPFQRAAVTADTDAESVQHVAVLIDRSASMRRDGLRDEVLQRVRDTVQDLQDEDLLSVYEFSRDTATRISADQWARSTASERTAMVDSVLEDYEPDWMATHTASALRHVADELAQENRPGSLVRKRRLVLITDFQAGSELDMLQNSAWPASVQLDLQIVRPTKPGNVGISWFKDRRTERVRVRLTSSGDSTESSFVLQPFDETGAAVGQPLPVTVTPGQRTTLLLPKADEATARAITGVELQGEPHPFDNVIDLPATSNPVIKVAHLGPPQLNDPESMRYYLQRALDGVTDQRVELIDVLREGGVAVPIPADVRLAVVTDPVPAGMVDSVRELLLRGGVLLVALNSVATAQSVQALLPDGFRVSEAAVSDYAMLGQIDFESPLFSAFADARFSDFSSIRFWNYRRLELPVSDRQPGAWNVVARFDSGDPAIVSTSQTSGRIVLLASGWQPNDSQWALSTRFPPLIASILALADPVRSDELAKTVGDIVQPGELVSADDWTVTYPDGRVATSEELAEASADQTAVVTANSETDTGPPAPMLELTEPGRYRITGSSGDVADGGQPVSVTLIAGLAAAESRTEALPAGQLQVLGIGSDNLLTDVENRVQSRDNIKAGQLSVSELETRQKLWRWFLLGGLACLLLEALLASWIQSRQIGSNT